VPYLVTDDTFQINVPLSSDITPHTAQAGASPPSLGFGDDAAPFGIRVFEWIHMSSGQRNTATTDTGNDKAPAIRRTALLTP
jgi:hypothetical protein